MTSTPQQLQVEAACQCIHRSFEDYNASFADITRRARRRFVSGDRAGMTQDVASRYALYDQSIYETIAELEQILGDRLFRRAIWVQIKQSYAERSDPHIDSKLYRTFFNTISRRLFSTTGVDEAIEFTSVHGSIVNNAECLNRISDVYDLDLGSESSIAQYFSTLADEWTQLSSLVLPSVEKKLHSAYGRDCNRLTVRVLQACLYRSGRAYRVGYVQLGKEYRPLIAVFNNGPNGVFLEALLTERRQLSILFGFTFNYFMADLDEVEPVIGFLSQMLPSKPIAELYTVLGRVKQGKTERYQSFIAHLSNQRNDKLVEAEGKKGMVMLVFTLPSYPLVFKLIRDRFAPSKQVTRSDVLERYHLVFRHDRIGRLIDAQEFRELKLPRDKVSKPLLQALESECQRLVEVDNEHVLIHHCYVERRVRPLDLYLGEAEEPAAAAAVLDYGQSIKDLARSNIFAGDLLPKNFGVTGSGRVVFYDYDELRLMSECRFRRWPQAPDDLMAMSSEPWFYVGEDDVFPEQFALFMGLGAERLAMLKAHHPEIFDPDWWVSIQNALTQGEALDVPPFGLDACIG